MTPQHLFMVIVVPMIWGMGLVVSKGAFTHFSPIFLMALRFTLAAICLLIFFRPPLSQIKGFFWVALISVTIQYSFTYLGVDQIDASTAGLLVQLEVPFGLFLGWLVFGDRLSGKQTIGIVIAFWGAVLIIGEPNLYNDLLYVFFIIVGALAWAFGQVMVKRLKQLNGFTVVTGLAVFGAPQLLLTSLVIEDNHWQQLTTAPPILWLSVLYLGIGMTVLGYAIWYYLLARYDVNKMVPYLLLVPVSSVTGGIIFLDETLTLRVLMGGVFSIIGVAFISLQHKQKNRVTQ